MQLEREAEREDEALINYTENKAERGKDKGGMFSNLDKKGARNEKNKQALGAIDPWRDADAWVLH